MLKQLCFQLPDRPKQLEVNLELWHFTIQESFLLCRLKSDSSCLRRVTKNKLDIVRFVIRTKFFSVLTKNLINDPLDSGQPGPVSLM